MTELSSSTSYIIAVWASIIVGVYGCATPPDPVEPVLPSSPITAVDLVPVGVDGAAALSEVASVLPENTVGVVVLDAETLFGETLRTGGGLLVEGWDAAPMMDQLSTHSRQRLGVDVTTVKRIVVAVSPEGPSAVLLDGQTSIQPAAEHVEVFKTEAGQEWAGAFLLKQETVVVMALGERAKGWAMVATPEQAEPLGDVQRGAMKAMATPKRDGLQAVLAQAGPGVITAAGVLGEDPTTQMLAMRMPTGIPDQMGMSLTSEGLQVVAQGNIMELTGVGLAVSQLMGQAKAKAERQLAQLDQLSALEGMAAIVMVHVLRGLQEPLTPQIANGVLTMTIPVPDGVVESLPVVSAVAATIAVPAWATYVKQSKAREAELNLKRLADGAMAFYLAERLNARGKAQPQRFPMSARSTPEPVRSCCARMGGPDADNDGQCDPNAVVWEQQGFREARFAPTTPQHFVYEIINNGKTGREAVLHLKAYGDLDCDGVTSEYSVTLEVNEGNEVTSTPVVVTDRELELE